MALNWRTVTTLELVDKLIPNPNAEHDLLDQLRNVRVAVEGSFLHVDPTPAGQDQGGEHNVFVIPGSAVRKAVYRVTAPAQTMIDVQVG